MALHGSCNLLHVMETQYSISIGLWSEWRKNFTRFPVQMTWFIMRWWLKWKEDLVCLDLMEFQKQIWTWEDYENNWQPHDLTHIYQVMTGNCTSPDRMVLSAVGSIHTDEVLFRYTWYYSTGGGVVISSITIWRVENLGILVS